jgi:hypothetical protein
MSPDEIYRLLQSVDEVNGFAAALQANPGPALKGQGLAFDQSVIDALAVVDWELPIDLLNEDLDFLMPETAPIDWGATAHYPVAEWGARVDMDLGNNGAVPEFLHWARQFRGSLSRRNTNTFKRLFVFSPLDGSTVHSMISVWGSGQDGARFLTDRRFSRLEAILARKAFDADYLGRDLFQVSGRVANDSVFQMGTIPYCLLRQWTILRNADGLEFRDNCFGRYEAMLDDSGGAFLGGLVGWSVRHTRTFYELLGYTSQDGYYQAEKARGVPKFDVELGRLAQQEHAAPEAPAAWTATVINERG